VFELGSEQPVTPTDRARTLASHRSRSRPR
jgi:hypothetical protein